MNINKKAEGNLNDKKKEKHDRSVLCLVSRSGWQGRVVTYWKCQQKIQNWDGNFSKQAEWLFIGRVSNDADAYVRIRDI